MRYSPPLRTTAVLLVASVLGGCGAAPEPVTVAEILAHCDAYKGKTVKAVGYLGQCEPRGCVLAARRSAYRAFVSRWLEHDQVRRNVRADPAAVDAAAQRLKTFDPLWLSDNPAWLKKAEPYQNSDVVVAGTVDKNRCTNASGDDYAATFVPTDIRAATPADGLPGNAN